MTKRPRKTTRYPAPTLPALLIELEASLPSLIAQPASFPALVRVCRSLDRAAAPVRRRAATSPARARATKPAADTCVPMSLPLFP